MIKLTNTSPDDLFTKSGWIMINTYVQKQMMRPEKQEWFKNSTFAEILSMALDPNFDDS